MLKPEYISYNQDLIKNNETSYTPISKVCTLSFLGDSYNIELPTGVLLAGKLSLKEVKDGNEIYITDTGCVLHVSINKIFLNIYRTHNLGCTFYLPNYKEPSFSEKIAHDVESSYEFNKKMHGEFVANCILERKVVTGLKINEVIAILGASKDVWLKQVNNKLEVAIGIYDDYYIVYRNAIAVYVERI